MEQATKIYSVSTGTKVSVILLGFIIGAGYQMFSTGASYAENVSRMKEETRNDKELVQTIKNGENDINIWKPIVDMEEMKLKQKELALSLSGTANIANKISELKDKRVEEYKKQKERNEYLTSEITNKGELLDRLDIEVEKRKVEIAGTRYWMLNMDSYKKKFLTMLDWNKDLRDKYYYKISQMNQFYEITPQSSDSLQLLTKLCDTVRVDYDRAELVCESSDAGVKRGLPTFNTLIFH